MNFAELLRTLKLKVSRNTDDAAQKAAINWAIREIASEDTSWEWLQIKDYPITTVGIYSTGTITLTQASRSVVLATGTWPSTAGNLGTKLKISGDSSFYEVRKRVSNSEIELKYPYGLATAAGQGYQLFQDAYIAPTDMKRGNYIRDPNGTYEPLPYMEDIDMDRAYFTSFNSGDPWAFNTDTKGLVRIYPAPEDARTLMLTYFRNHPPLVNNDDRALMDDDFHNAIITGAMIFLADTYETTFEKSKLQKEYDRMIEKLKSNNKPPAGTVITRRSPYSGRLDDYYGEEYPRTWPGTIT